MLKVDIPPHEQYIVDVLLNCASGGSVSTKDKINPTPTPGGIQPCPPNQKGSPLVVPVILSTLEGISHLRIYLPKDLRPDLNRETAWKSILEVQRRFPDGVPLLDPVKDMKIKDEKFTALVQVCRKLIYRSITGLNLFWFRKLKQWKTRCTKIHCIQILGFLNYMPCIKIRRSYKTRFGL